MASACFSFLRRWLAAGVVLAAIVATPLGANGAGQPSPSSAGSKKAQPNKSPRETQTPNSGKLSAAGTRKIELPGPADAVVGARAAVAPKPLDYKSTHFLVHSDLPAKEAHELLAKLEVMLGLISKYWEQPLAGTIECYVVDNLGNWPEGSLDPAGRAKIEQRAGITLVETLSLGEKPVAAKAVVYAVAERGTAQHEAVHAYCGQTFGRTGPLWYAEGMAEMGQYWQHGDSSVHCHPFVAEYIRASRPKPLSEILRDGNGPGPAMAGGDTWQNYAWRWALCHMLVNNPNYAPRFRPLGLAFLSGGKMTFLDAFGSMLPEIDFEYRFFLKHFDQGYRVDLCGWDWTRKFRALSGSTPLTTRVVANRGWQPSGLLVARDAKYEYSANGAWRTSKEAAETTADGADGQGRLEAVVFNDFVLSEPFSLGAYGTFQSPAAGQLHLRCADRWNELADNRGWLSVKFKLAGQGLPLAKPARVARESAPQAE